MTNRSSEDKESYIRSRGADPKEDFVDPAVFEVMTSEGQDLVKRVLGSTSLRIHVLDSGSLRKHNQ